MEEEKIIKPQTQQQIEALDWVRCRWQDSQRLSETRRKQLVEVYQAVATFNEPRQNNWSSAFKVNKAFQIVNEIAPDLTARDPRWIVSVRDPSAFNFPKPPEGLDPALVEQAQQQASYDNIKKAAEHAKAIQDYLTYIFDEYNLMEQIQDYGKSGIEDGKSYAEVVYKSEIARLPTIKEEIQLDEMGQPVLSPEDGTPIKIKKPSVNEKVYGEYPTIDIIDWTEMYYDPRYKYLRDRPYMIRIKYGVRLADLLRKKKDYINLDLVEQTAAIGQGEQTLDDTYRNRILSITGISGVTEVVDKNALKLRYFTGLYNMTPDDPIQEKMYRITTVNDIIVIQMEEITQQPIEEWKCFPDTKSANAVGFIEPIIAIQEEMNFKKNSASEYINKALTRQVIWSPNSGIDPRKINDPVIPTTQSAQTALANFVELPMREIHPSYFQEQNDMERQMQNLSFRVDVTQPEGTQALTNTATGARIKFYESNKVRASVRKRFEKALERIAYKLLQCAFENMEDNIVFKKMGTQEYWMANKEILRDAITKYTIKIETNSSSSTDVESRRDDAIALWNIAVQAKGLGLPVSLDKAFGDVIATFEGRDPSTYLQAVPVQPPMTPQPPMGGTPAPIPMDQGAPQTTADLTRAVAGGKIGL